MKTKSKRLREVVSKKPLVSYAQIAKFKKQGQYPRKTKNWLRYRQQEPSKFSKFRIKEVSAKRKLVIGKLKSSGKWVLQSIMKKR